MPVIVVEQIPGMSEINDGHPGVISLVIPKPPHKILKGIAFNSVGENPLDFVLQFSTNSDRFWRVPRRHSCYTSESWGLES